MNRHRLPLVLVLVTALLITAGTVLASTTKSIRGTARADTIRGTSGPDSIYGLGGDDKLYGGGGNDKLYGGAGNDRIVAGAGADVISCGAGSADVAVGDARDKADASCETTRGIPKTGGTPTPPPPPPAAACSNAKDDDGDGKVDFPADPGCDSASDTDETDPAPPPPPPIQAGTYCGFTEQGPGLCVITSADATSVSKFQTSSIMDCSANGQAFRLTLDVEIPDAGVAIQPDHSFSYSFDGTEPDGQGLSNIHETYFIKGMFTVDGKADGTFAFTSLSFDYQGVHYSCTQNPVGWHVARQ